MVHLIYYFSVKTTFFVLEDSAIYSAMSSILQKNTDVHDNHNSKCVQNHSDY